ncbi:MAG: hypothetical protein LLG42_04440 [Chloroflexi bacterium]|nr:hypothetical protein [Chloroflexota bacterium]
MKKFLYVLILVLAVWLAISPFLLGSTSWLRKGVDLAAALVVTVLVVLGTRNSGSKYPAWIILFIGLAMIVWGAIARPLTGGPGGASEIIVGVFWLILAFVITQLFVFSKMSIYDKGGIELTSMSVISFKNENIAIKAILLGSMPSTLYLHPEELWKALPLVDESVIWHLPAFIYKGWKLARRQAREAENKPSPAGSSNSNG